MGLRHRTPMAALRELRRCAENVGYKSDRHVAMRLAGLKGSLRFRQLLEGSSQVQLRTESTERAQRLLSRLRQAIKPDPELPENDRNAKTEYAALQEELMRLTQIEQALRRQLPGDHLPTETSYPYEGEEPMVRRIQICVVPPAGDTEERPKIQALQAPLTDLDAYKTLLRQKTLEECPSTPKRANLVVVPDCTHEGERMPSGEMPDASQAAQLTVESLKESSFELNKAVLQNIKLSLLDT